MIYLAPVLPAMARKAGDFLGAPLARWDEIYQPLLGSAIKPYEPLALRLEPKTVAQLIEAANAPAATLPTSATAQATAQATAKETPTAGKPLITIEDFAKLDLRIARVLDAAEV